MCHHLQATIRYVKPVPTGTGNGSSWANAGSLQGVLNVSVSGDVIWATGGTYKPTSIPAGCIGCGTASATNRNNTFLLKSGVKLYGGFTGTESEIYQRRFSPVNESILSGFIGATINLAAYHVVTAINCSYDTLLDQFTIQESTANGSGSITVSGKTYYQVWGGGILNIDSDVNITRCRFYNNYAESGGAILNTDHSNPTIWSSIFISNSASGAGGIYNHDFSSPIIENCTFISNSATAAGGAMYNYNGSNPQISKCIFWNNYAPTLPEIANNGGTPIVSYSIIKGGYSPCTLCPNTNGNIDPQFVSNTNLAGPDNIFRTGDDGLALRRTSPAINAGQSPNDGDFLSNSFSSLPSLGAYEFMPKYACVGFRHVADNPIEAGTHISYDKLTANGTVGSSTYVVFEANNQITLLPGFSTQNSAVFRADIKENCLTTEASLRKAN